jgi:hypothetical protein
MAKSSRTEQFANDRTVLLMQLRKEQAVYKEGSLKWQAFQRRIDEIIAKNYLEHLNA